MVSRLSYASVAVLTAGLFFGTTGCSKKTVQASDPGLGQSTQETRATTSPNTKEVPGSLASIDLQAVYFDYDQSRLRSDGIATLNTNGKSLRAHPGVRVVLEGHCDERGTVEYNLALGDRRARAVRDFLVNSGVERERLTTVSFGEERPFAPGHTESAWAQNRRVHFNWNGPLEQASNAN